MKRLHAIILAITICCSISAGAQTPKRQTTPVQPSLDLLVSRIESYWKSLELKKKVQASQFIIAADRDAFLAAGSFSFSDPRFKALELSPDRKEASVTVLIKRSLAAGLPITEVPVIEVWRFERGNWHRRFENARLPFAEGTKVRQLSPEQAGDVKRTIQQTLRFETSVLDFGTVRESTAVQLSLKYSLDGNEYMPVRLRLPPDFWIRGLSNQTIPSGQNKELIVEAPIWKFDGAVNESITLIAYRQGVEVPFKFTVKGTVFVPVSISPKRFKLDKTNPEQEVLVRNNLKSDVELASLYSESDKVTVEPIPATIPPGQQVKLKARFIPGASRMTMDNLAIRFAKPVDDVRAIGMTVLFNLEEKSLAPDFLPADKSRNCKRTTE